MLHEIRVVNGNNFEIADFFDGIAYVFAPKEPKNVPLDAAKHIFGVDFPADAALLKTLPFRNQIWNHLQKRWGWNSHDEKKTVENRKKFDHIEFIPVTFNTVEMVVGADTPEMTPPRPAKEMQQRGNFKPRVDEAEEEVA